MYGVIFLGTLYRGSNSTLWATLGSNIAKLVLQSSNNSILRSLYVDSKTLQIITKEFSTMIRDNIQVYSFYKEIGMVDLYRLYRKVISILGILFFTTDKGFIDCQRLFFHYRRCSERQRRYKWQLL